MVAALQQLRAFFLGNQTEFADGATMRTRPHRIVEQHQQMLRRTQHLFVSHGGGVVDPTESAVSLADLQYRARAGSHDGGNPSSSGCNPCAERRLTIDTAVSQV